MGLRGPPPTPTPILKARGSWLVKGRKGEPKLVAKAPACPGWLSDEAKTEWRRAVKLLAAMRVLTEADRAALAAYCEAWAELVQLRADCDAMRAAFKDVESLAVGGEALNKLVRLKNAAADRVVKIAAQFGFTPAARARVKAGEDNAGGGDQSKARFFRSG